MELNLVGMDTIKQRIILSEEASKMAKEHWGLDVRINVTVNGRLTRALGLMKSYGQEYKWIELSKRLIDNGASSVIKDILLHEVTHWVLKHGGYPYKDGHPFFENELRRVGASSTLTYRVGAYHTYTCDCEGVEHTSARRLNRHMCNTCEASLKYSHVKSVDGLGNEKVKETI